MTLDAVGQRQCVLAITVAIQCIKIYDWLHLNASLGIFLIKWITIETVLFLSLWRARIPRLTFSFLLTLFFTILACVVNVALFAGVPGTVKFIRLHYMPLSATVEMVGIEHYDVDDIAGSKEHLLEGSLYTSRLYLPWAVGNLNPERKILCLPTSTPMPNSQGLSEALRRPIVAVERTAKIGIPLFLSGVGPWTVTIVRDGSFYSEIIVKESAPSKSLTEIMVDQPGKFQISKIVDGNGSPGRIDSAEPVEIASCPQARLDGLVIKHGVEMCNNASFPVKLWLSGHSPFTVFFETVDEKLTEQVVVSAVFPSATKNGQFDRWTYNLPGNPHLSQYLLRIAAIQDSTGRMHRYGTWDNGDAVIVNLVPPPTIKWAHLATNALKLKENEPHISLKVEMLGRSPFSFEIGRPDGTSLQLTGITDKSTLIKASAPGTYRLKSFKDSMCKGKIDIQSELSVQLVHAPTLNATAETLKSPCRGDMGIAFKLNLTGEGPWRIQARQRNRNLKSDQMLEIKAQTPRLDYVWKPSLPGVYELDLLALSDSNFSKQTLKNLHYVQEISPAPDASFPRKSEVFGCVGNGIVLPVLLSGTAPLVLEYSILHPDGTTDALKLETSSEKVDLRLEEFTQGGRFVVTLVSVVDSFNCIGNISSQSVSITVFSHPPSVGFSTAVDKIVKIREGTRDLVPITLTANKPPVTLYLRHSDGVETFKIDSNAVGLPLNKSGIWSIESVSDEFCQGKVLQPTVEVMMVPKPSAKFDDSASKLTCRLSKDFKLVKASVSGSGIINLSYTVQYALDEAGLRTAQKDRKLVSGSAPYLSLSSPSHTAPGFYHYDLLSVSDSSFSEQTLKEQSVVQQVLPDPAPHVLSALDTSAFCYDPTHRRIGPFLLDFTGSELKGSLPVQFSYELLHGSNLSTEGTVTSTDSKIPIKFDVDGISAPGPYHLRVTRVENAFGCVWDLPPRISTAAALKDKYALSVNVIERPSIASAPDQLGYFCVGDVARFELMGTGPWTVSYTLKDEAKSKKKTDTVSINRLNILLAESGTLVIHTVCNKHCCAEIPPTGLEYSVHSLPSAAISDGMQYLREGEETEFSVSLRGVPPFAFAYQCIDESGSRVIDTVTVNDVKSTEHHIKVSSSGTFRVVQVKDRFCQYPKKR